MKTDINKPATLAQKVFGKDFDNSTIINERPDHLRSTDPEKDKVLFQKYRAIRRQQTRVIRYVLR